MVKPHQCIKPEMRDKQDVQSRNIHVLYKFKYFRRGYQKLKKLGELNRWDDKLNSMKIGYGQSELQLNHS